VTDRRKQNMTKQKPAAKSAKKPPPKIQNVRWKGTIPRAKIRKAVREVLKQKSEAN
jgi:hypothetical protein